MTLTDTAALLGLTPEDLIPYGRDKAKLPISLLDRPRQRSGKPRLILVSAMTPTPAGEGKTTTSIGLVQAFHRQGRSVCAALREPSLGPCFGIKGGGTGGGKSRLEPSVDINLHFTGDLHAITAANNLLAAMADNALHFGTGDNRMDIRRVVWRRVLDVNDRALRSVITGLGGPTEGVPREAGFDITAASEVMAILALAEGPDDLRRRLGRIVVGFNEHNDPVTADDLQATGAMMALLKDAIHPNLVQTTEGAPAIVHCGPFANIAHGCNSVLATRMAMHHADWVFTEAGFGFDLGAEKFFDIKCAGSGLVPDGVVIVATVRALKYHGGVPLDDLNSPDVAAVEKGLPNLYKHIEISRAFGLNPVIAINLRGTESKEEIEAVRAHCAEKGVPCAPSNHFAEGGEGALELADIVAQHVESGAGTFKPLYDWSLPPLKKIEAIARTVYGAAEVTLSKKAQTQLGRVRRLGLAGLPICMAKTQSSLSDDPKALGRPSGFELQVSEVRISAGAGFLVVLTGDIVRMPGLGRVPQAVNVDLVDGEIVGIG